MVGRRFVCSRRSDDHAFFARAAPERYADRHRTRQRRRRVLVRDRDVGVLRRVEREARFVDDRVEPRRHRDLRHADVGARRKSSDRSTVDLRLVCESNLRRRNRRCRVDEDVETVLPHHLHHHQPQDLAHLQVLRHAGRHEIDRVLPVLHRRDATRGVVLRVRVERRPVLHALVAAAEQVLCEVVAEVRGRTRTVDAPHVDAVRPRREPFARLHHVVTLGDVVAGDRGRPLHVFRKVERQDLGERLLERIGHVWNRRVVRVERVDRLDDRRAELIAQHPRDVLVDDVAHRPVVGGVLDHVLADDSDAHPRQRLLRLRAVRRGGGVRGVRLRRNQPAWQRRVDVARIEIAALRILQRVEHRRGIGDGAALNAAAIEIRIGADRAAIRNQSLRRDEGDDVIAPRRLAA